MALTGNIIITSIKPYHMVDEKTGEINAGIPVWYFPSDNLRDKKMDGTRDYNHRGEIPAEANIPYSELDKLKKTGIYHVRFAMVSTKERKFDNSTKMATKIQPVEILDFLGEIEVNVIPPNNKPKP